MSIDFSLSKVFQWNSPQSKTFFVGCLTLGVQQFILSQYSHENTVNPTETISKATPELNHVRNTNNRNINFLCRANASKLVCGLKHAVVPIMVMSVYHLSYHYWRPKLWYKVRNYVVKDSDYSLFRNLHSPDLNQNAESTQSENNLQNQLGSVQNLNEDTQQNAQPLQFIKMVDSNDEPIVRIFPGTNTLISIITRVLPLWIAIECSFQYYRRISWVKAPFTQSIKRMTIFSICMLLLLDSIQDDFADMTNKSNFLSLDIAYPRKENTLQFFQDKKNIERYDSIKNHLRSKND